MDTGTGCPRVFAGSNFSSRDPFIAAESSAVKPDVSAMRVESGTIAPLLSMKSLNVTLLRTERAGHRRCYWLLLVLECVLIAARSVPLRVTVAAPSHAPARPGAIRPAVQPRFHRNDPPRRAAAGEETELGRRSHAPERYS